jgi:hypothetical protein
MFRYRPPYLIAGFCLLVLGFANYVAARPAQPVEIDGTESTYFEITSNGSYAHNELQLTGDPATYTLSRSDFHPPLPDYVYKNGKIQIWVDEGSTTIIAITLFDENDQNPRKYTTARYDDPSSTLPGEHDAGIVLGGLGVIALIVFAAWPLVARRRAESALSTFAQAGLSEDGRYRWDGARWRALGDPDAASGVPPPPES